MRISLTLIFVLIISINTYSNELKKYQQKGIQLYKQKSNREALNYLSKALTFDDKNGKTNYYLGNVYMNLHEYEKAVKCYKLSWKKKYQLNNSIFNLACAYSLLNKPRKALASLYLNYQKGDRKTKRIKSDNDLSNFRKTKYYNYYFKAVNLSTSPGTIPKTKKQFIQNIFTSGKTCYPESGPLFMGFFKFHKDGYYNFFTGSSYTGEEIAGTWEIDENRNIFIIRELGKIKSIGIKNKNQELINKYSDNGFYRNNKKYLWIEKYSKPKIEKIPFNKIKFNLFGIAAFPDFLDNDFYFYTYMEFESKLIPAKIGKRILDKEFEKFN